MAEVTVADFAKVLKVPVDRLIEQLDEAGIKVGGPNDVISEDAKLELLTHLKKNHGRKDAADSAPRRITLSRKSQSELKLASGQGRARTINVEVRQKRTYIKRDVLEEQARKQQEELDAARRADEESRTAVERSVREEQEKREAEERAKQVAEQREAEERKRLEDEQRRAAAADEAAKQRADEERRKAALAEKESQQRADAERARQKAKKERMVEEPSDPDHTLHVADGMAGRRKKKKQRRRGVPMNVDPQHGFEKPTAPVVRDVEIGDTITVSELASRMAIKANEVIKALMKMGMMVTINQVLDQDTATLVVEEMGHTAKPLKETAIEDRADPIRRGGRQRIGSSDARSGRHHHGPCRSRQDFAARLHPHDARRRRRGRGYHAAHRRLQRRDAEGPNHVPRHPGPRGFHRHARARRKSHGHRRARRRRGRRRDAANDRGRPTRQSGRCSDRRRGQQDRQAWR